MRIGFLSVAHMHAYGYAAAIARCGATNAGVWDDDAQRGESFAKRFSIKYFESQEKLLENCDSVIITSENARHAKLAARAAAAGKHILCEKPLATNEEDGQEMLKAAKDAQINLMTAFPCRFSPAYSRMKERLANGDIGKILAICATNHGCCPFDWFVKKQSSGGGAMMDHTVHIADLLRDMLHEEPDFVYAQTSNNIYGEDWEDTAMLHVGFPSGIFATIDSSWSRPESYKTWGDVRMNVVGDRGVLELDMFAQAFDMYTGNGHSQQSFGSNLDDALLRAFVVSIENKIPAPVSGEDGLAAARFAFAGYESLRTGQPARVN